MARVGPRARCSPAGVPRPPDTALAEGALALREPRAVDPGAKHFLATPSFARVRRAEHGPNAKAVPYPTGDSCTVETSAKCRQESRSHAGESVHRAASSGPPGKKTTPALDRFDGDGSYWVNDNIDPSHQQFRNRAHGLTAGLATGNLFGIKQEGWSRGRIRAAYPEGIHDIEALPGFPDDDEIAQAIVIAEAAADGPLDMNGLGQRFREWAEVNGAGIGGLTRRVMALYGGSSCRRGLRNGRAPRPPREPKGVPILEASRTAWDGCRAGNGAATRCAPIAIRWCDEPKALVRNSVISAVPTHWDRRCGWSCALLSLTAAAALRGESITANRLLAQGLEGACAALPELQRYGYEARIPDSVREAVLQAREAGFDSLDTDGKSTGFTLFGLKVGLSMFWEASSFEKGLRAVVEAGGDVDSNGAIAGALLGARFGVEAIPQRWRTRMAELRNGRTRMESYADRLLEACGGRDARSRAASAHSRRGTPRSGRVRNRPARRQWREPFALVGHRHRSFALS